MLVWLCVLVLTPALCALQVRNLCFIVTKRQKQCQNYILLREQTFLSQAVVLRDPSSRLSRPPQGGYRRAGPQTGTRPKRRRHERLGLAPAGRRCRHIYTDSNWTTSVPRRRRARLRRRRRQSRPSGAAARRSPTWRPSRRPKQRRSRRRSPQWRTSA